jgi:two-component system, sensor histidine kinase
LSDPSEKPKIILPNEISEKLESVLEDVDPKSADKIRDLFKLEKQNLANTILSLKSKLNKAEAEMQKTLSDLNKANKSKEDFLSTISHELRTPLNTIILLVELMEMDDGSGQFSESIEKIRTSTRSLIQIINDLLDITKSDAGKLSLNNKHFNLKELVETTCDIFKSKIEQKKLILENTIYNDVMLNVVSDPARIRQILMNLIGNAIKFTESGFVKIRVYAKETHSNHQIVNFEIKDSGIGIDLKENEDIFEHFTQMDTSATRKYGGTGLGLAICKRLTDLLKGQISCASKQEKGSAFNFEIPLHKPEVIDDKAVSNSVQNIEKQKRVLLVDDDEDMLVLTERILSKSNYKVNTASSGYNALTFTANEKYNIIFMDCRMPGLDGFECTKAIRENEENKNRETPIIALTANVLKEDIDKSKEVGMNGFLAKPIEKEELLTILEKYSVE